MKLGAVPYLNALPLIHYLPEKPRLAPPAALDRLLRLGEVDFATAPVTTLFENPDYAAIPNLAIGTKGSVRSVRLILKKPGLTLADVGSIDLDLESRASAMLLKVLLHFKYKRDLSQIDFITPLPSPDPDAVMLIGDKALRDHGASHSLDLGHEWTSWTKLPFVFAAWIGKNRTCPPGLVNTLQSVRDKALREIDEVAHATNLLPFAEARSYLTENVSYDLSGAELEGLHRFHAYASELKLCPSGFRLRLYPE